MLANAFVTLAILTLSTPAPAAPSPPPSTPAPRHVARETKRPLLAPQFVRPEDLYSLHARRRVATYLRMRLLELRSEGLSRAAQVIEHRLPLDAIAPTPESTLR
jgi:hypothetical protein